ncbi:vacuolar protein sorting-associated protein [Striga asiatica]|uniref:Vacuolar protein sorting-associated protein n=1 Tax=Striga asiatica TaxID=4170 RepID=A0A5A7P6M2_STRAF|nr:vacuolar protein sorting-associated protein [Striga asiatica]
MSEKKETDDHCDRGRRRRDRTLFLYFKFATLQALGLLQSNSSLAPAPALSRRVLAFWIMNSPGGGAIPGPSQTARKPTAFRLHLIRNESSIECISTIDGVDEDEISSVHPFSLVNSLTNASVRTMWEYDVHPHYVMRRYAEFTASLIQLNADYGNGMFLYSSSI